MSDLPTVSASLTTGPVAPLLSTRSEWLDIKLRRDQVDPVAPLACRHVATSIAESTKLLLINRIAETD
ncbi:hypothetical protein ACN47E_000871 [Coniothyrium glycines]